MRRDIITAALHRAMCVRDVITAALPRAMSVRAPANLVRGGEHMPALIAGRGWIITASVLVVCPEVVQSVVFTHTAALVAAIAHARAFCVCFNNGDRFLR